MQSLLVTFSFGGVQDLLRRRQGGTDNDATRRAGLDMGRASRGGRDDQGE